MSEAIVIVAGPTASGKSAAAAAVAAAFDGVVVNADSMQVYADLRVLTARPGADLLAHAPHRLFGIVPAATRFSTGAWRARAVAEIADIHGVGRLPVLCGGTGLYLKALLDGLAPVPAIPPAIRRAVRARYAEIGGATFRDELAERDAEAARRLAPGDRQRLCRAREVVEATGRPLSDWQRETSGAAGYRTATILFAPPRETLYAACDARFEAMMANGALDEVRALLARGLDPAVPAMKALGVAALARHLAGEIDREEAIEAAQRATRNYAKRQMTWFRHQAAPDLVFAAQYSESLNEEIFAFIRQFLLTDGGETSR